MRYGRTEELWNGRMEACRRDGERGSRHWQEREGRVYVQTRTTAGCRRGGGAGLHSDRGRGERGEGRIQQAIVDDATLVVTANRNR